MEPDPSPDAGSGALAGPDPRIGGEQEAAVLEALDPFWTRGIIMPRPPPLGRRDRTPPESR